MLTWEIRRWGISVGENNLEKYEMHRYIEGTQSGKENDA